MEGAGAIVLFILGVVLGCVIVMLLWMAHPGCIALPTWAGGTGTAAAAASNLTYPGGAYTNMVITDKAGRTIATTGDKGTPSTFTDANGNTKNVLCYMSYYCVDQTPCENNQCIAYGQRCSSGSTIQQASNNMANYNPATTAYTGSTASSTGECCSPYECINGYCGEQKTCVKTGGTCTSDSDCCEGQCTNGICGAQQCQQENYRCGYVYPTQTYTMVAPNRNATYYGECCDPFQCVNNTCVPQNQCVETGKTCGRVQNPSIVTAVVYTNYGECCSTDECVNNVCTPPQECQSGGQACEYATTGPMYTNGTLIDRTWHGECCNGYTCANGYCTTQCAKTGAKCDANVPCCDGSACTNGYCAALQTCQKTNAICGYGPPTAPIYTNNLPVNRTYYGDCCSGDTCVDGYCQPPCGETGGKCSSTLACCAGYCVSGVCATCEPSGYACKADSECCGGYTCQDKKCAKACTENGNKCNRDSECCTGSLCSNGVCRTNTCGEQGQSCGLGVECCSGMECSDNGICVACASVGDTCGGQYTTVGAAGSSCCSTGYCYSGTCKQKTDYMCTDTENGPDYYTEGSATGVYKSSYGTYTDYCSGDTLYEYYCEVPDEYSTIKLATITCPNGCTAGECNQGN